MKPSVFIDTSYVLALVNKRDRYHESALSTSKLLSPPFVTTEAVLIEIGNALSQRAWRSLAVATLDRLRNSPEIEVVAVDPVLLERAIALFAARSDKDWGLTDCISFVVMQERGLTQALTADQHFAQAGFRSILADA